MNLEIFSSVFRQTHLRTNRNKKLNKEKSIHHQREEALKW